ncbi:hypothetical protein SYJ56_12710 [Algoriphagus sp. D3-2-R+10]|nr:hypothetical protein [Algoriphagus sp. D3-2-R+10]MEB2776176.1 hypothetical protein [Algoriphagus sp. D3-2-R+10]
MGRTHGKKDKRPLPSCLQIMWETGAIAEGWKRVQRRSIACNFPLGLNG